MRKTVIIGATPNPTRYAYLAAERLHNHQEEFIPVGIKQGELFGQRILDLRQKPTIKDVDTITLYLNPTNQKEWEDYILSLEPYRIIFNPGTENPPFAERANTKGILTENACTLVLLGTGLY
ncbi:MAG: CoA-binding protein [Cyclobacteriaceae bacterium]